jgi:hypothetical protein
MVWLRDADSNGDDHGEAGMQEADLKGEGEGEGEGESSGPKSVEAHF